MRSLVGAVLLCIALGSVVQTNWAAVTGPKPAFDWTQFLKGAKRAAATDAAVPNAEEVDIDYQDSQFQIKPMISNPMTPFLSMKPYLPKKPTFMPPLVDPQYFIDKKTALLNGMFSPVGVVGGKAMGGPPFGGMAAAPNYFAGKKTAFLSTLFNQLATPPPLADTNVNATKPAVENILQRRLIAPWLITTPPPLFDPKVMADKKTAFLDKLFSSFNTATSADDTLDTATVKPTIVPADFWMPFPAKTKTAMKPAVKPTIVPPDFWVPFPGAGGGLKPIAPAMDPSVFIDKKTKFINDLMSSLSGPPTAAPSPDPIPSYDDEVTLFLDKLLEALITPTILELKRSVARSTRGVVPTTETPDVTLSAKDKVTNTIIGELTGIKNNMVDTVTQMIKDQKQAAIVAPLPGAKPGKKASPFGAPFGGPWGPMAKLQPTPDPTTPFQQKIDVLNQVFDMLTDLQKSVVAAVNEAGKPPANTTTTPVKNATNMTILDLLRNKFVEMDDAKASETKQMYGGPFKYSMRDVNELPEPVDTASKERSIKMAVHQGYQSFPPGTTELLQAGGGSSSQGKEGGGITLQKPSMDRYNAAWESRLRHHHHNK